MNGKVVILLFGLSLVLCHAVPVKRQASHDELSIQLKRVELDLEVMQKVEPKSFCPDPTKIWKCANQVEFRLGQQALCYVYDRYMDYTLRLLSTPSDSPLFATYTANQFVAWKSLNSTCNWVRLNTTNSTLPDCTIPEIQQVCTFYRIYESFHEIKFPLLGLIRELEPPIVVDYDNVADWLEANLSPEPETITSTLLRTTNCNKDSDGGFSC